MICSICNKYYCIKYKDNVDICYECRQNIENKLPNNRLNINDILQFSGVTQIEKYVDNDGKDRYLKIKYKRIKFSYFKCDECNKWFIKLKISVNHTYEIVRDSGVVFCSNKCRLKNLHKNSVHHCQNCGLEIGSAFARCKSCGYRNSH